MTFSSIPFLFYFLPIFLVLYAVSPGKNIALLCASLVFYAWGEPAHILFLLLSLVVNHILARAIARKKTTGFCFSAFHSISPGSAGSNMRGSLLKRQKGFSAARTYLRSLIFLSASLFTHFKPSAC